MVYRYLLNNVAIPFFGTVFQLLVHCDYLDWADLEVLLLSPAFACLFCGHFPSRTIPLAVTVSGGSSLRAMNTIADQLARMPRPRFSLQVTLDYDPTSEEIAQLGQRGQQITSFCQGEQGPVALRLDVARAIARMPSLTSLDLGPCGRLEGGAMRVLATGTYPALKTLRLPRVPLLSSEETLDIGKLDAVRTLTTPALGDYAHLCGMQLFELTISNRALTGQALATLPALPHLRKLELNTCMEFDSPEGEMLAKRKIRTLKLVNLCPTTAFFQSLALNRSIRELYLFGLYTLWDTAILAPIADIPQLELLCLQGSTVSVSQLCGLGPTTIQKLGLRDCCDLLDFDAANLNLIGQFQSLGLVDLCGCANLSATGVDCLRRVFPTTCVVVTDHSQAGGC